MPRALQNYYKIYLQGELSSDEVITTCLREGITYQ